MYQQTKTKNKQYQSNSITMIKEEAKISKQSESTVPIGLPSLKCEICSTENAEFYCSECLLRYCQKCEDQAHSSLMKKKHEKFIVKNIFVQNQKKEKENYLEKKNKNEKEKEKEKNSEKIINKEFQGETTNSKNEIHKPNLRIQKQEAFNTLFEIYRKISEQVKRTKITINIKTNKTKNFKKKPKQTPLEEIRSCLVLKPTVRWEPIYRYTHKDPTFRLHAEIMDFYEAIAPTEEDKKIREGIIKRVTKIIQKKWKNATVVIYGSYACGCYLPTSDIDLSVLITNIPERCEKLVLQLGSILRSKKYQKQFTAVSLIRSAKVPIVKLKDKASGIPIDISFNLFSCQRAVALTKQQIRTYPPLLPLLLVIKLFLKQHDLNEPFYGGIGSYSLMLMIVSHLQMHPCANEMPAIANLGKLLIDFFDLYANFNYITTGISIANNGYYFNKRLVGVFDINQPHLPYLQDPLDSRNNTTRSTYAILECREAFASAFESIKQNYNLKSILNINNQTYWDYDYQVEYYSRKKNRKKNRSNFH
ncbi:inactive non-canonical poly(a) RNA polymerase protein trf4-2-related [Anaeramoeba flamelloides]|uniref:Inactive non-canonical poly(A) RNA polymerase protein trf4-2-related n=1 Tax=Anaeramoeba flamelloides TaxID=1746091 RepID=A0AAV7YUU9_9EUKA|nr:inactive non-canonical poly(a) RNA polymerase protein trf4-2-related [Anaeramoeba flamelloides]